MRLNYVSHFHDQSCQPKTSFRASSDSIYMVTCRSCRGNLPSKLAGGKYGKTRLKTGGKAATCRHPLAMAASSPKKNVKLVRPTQISKFEIDANSVTFTEKIISSCYPENFGVDDGMSNPI